MWLLILWKRRWHEFDWLLKLVVHCTAGYARTCNLDSFWRDSTNDCGSGPVARRRYYRQNWWSWSLTCFFHHSCCLPYARSARSLIVRFQQVSHCGTSRELASFQILVFDQVVYSDMFKVCCVGIVVNYSFITIRYDRWFALENWQASCQFNLAHELKEIFLNKTKKK